MRIHDLLENSNLGLTIFDIDDTLMHTTAQIKVVKDGKIVRSLNNQEFNTYELRPGEEFDFGEFRDAEKFNRESKPIPRMIAKLKSMLQNAGDSKIIMLTARSDFDNKDLFLDTFRKLGIDMSRVHVHRAGNLGISPAKSKVVWVKRYLDTGKYGRVRLYDDSMANLRAFNGLIDQYPEVEFKAFFVNPDGSTKIFKERDPATESVLGLSKIVKEDTLPRYTAAEWAIIEGGHCLEDLSESVPKQPGRLFASLTEGYKLQLERDKNLLVLNIVDNATGKRTEVRGKPGYETNGYDANDPLHKLLDVVGKSANISELMNGEVVTINPKHPDAARALAATDRAYNEAFDTDTDWVLDMDSGGIQVFATKVEDAYIELTYKRMANDDVYIAFSRGGRTSVTGEGNQNKIFGAVINHIKQWVNKNNPPRIVFSAFKPNTGAFGSQDATRSSLYRKMVQRFASQNGYEYDVEDTGNEDTFILTKQNVEENISEESGKEMLKIFRGMHHDSDMNKSMDRFILSKDWKLGDFTPDMFPSEEEFFDYDDPFDRIIDIDYSHRVDLNTPIIVGPQYKDGKYSVIDGNHRAAAAQRAGKPIKGYFPVEKTNENFADGKKPGRKGLAKRSGVNTKASVSSLRKTAKNSSGEKQRMAHWLANMKAGKAKKK